jgi:dolichol kinase/phosphoserine phosphatase
LTPSLNKPKLVVFDVEGVLIPKNRFFFMTGKAIGFTQVVKVLFFGFLYETGMMPLKKALKHLFGGLRGMKIETMMQIAAKIPLMPEAQKVFNHLKTQGVKTALISSGLPTMVVQLFADKLGADYVFGFEVGVNRDVLTGEMWGDVIEQNGKLSILRRLVDDEYLTLGDCAVVADDRNNAAIFLRDVIKIGYNPDFVLRIKADSIVTGRISKVLAVLNGEPKHIGKPSRNDVFRELIHASGFFVPVVVLYVGAPAVAASIVVVLIFYAASEYLRTEGKKMPLINFITKQAASQNELYQLVLAPVYFALGILFTLLLFPTPVSTAAIAIFALGDSTASLFGRCLARTPLPLNKDKSLEGSAAGFFFAFLAGSVFISPLVALVGAAVAMFIEYLPLPINDNLLMPLFTGLTLILLVR